MASACWPRSIGRKASHHDTAEQQKRCPLLCTWLCVLGDIHVLSHCPHSFSVSFIFLCLQLSVPNTCPPRCFISHGHDVPLPRAPCLSLFSRLILRYPLRGSFPQENPLKPQPEPSVPPACSQQHQAERTNGALRFPWLHPRQTSLMDHHMILRTGLSWNCLP